MLKRRIHVSKKLSKTNENKEKRKWLINEQNHKKGIKTMNKKQFYYE